MNNRLYSDLYLHLKNIYKKKKKKKSSTFANLLMEKPGNWFAIAKMWKKHLEKEILRKGPASLLQNSLWDSFQFLLVQINHLVSPLEEHRLQMGYSKQSMG